MHKSFITIADSQDTNKIEIQYNKMPSHQIETTLVNKILKESDSDFWMYKPEAARDLGKELFSVLDGTGGKLRSEMEAVLREGEDLEIYLDLPSKWDGLPFELMFHEGFLVLDHDVNIFRLVNDRGRDRKAAPEKRPMKILFMACDPEEAPTLNFEAEEELILRETEKLHLSLDVEDSGSVEGLHDMVVGAGGFDLVHISGHAGLDQELGPVFYMEDEIGRLDRVVPGKLRKALKGFFPRILFLSGCSTGRQDFKREGKDDISSFTEQMVSFGIPFVMGWARPVSDVGATFLAANLFKYLSMGKEISEAVCMVRQDVSTLGQKIKNIDLSWALFRVYSDATPGLSIIPAGMGIRTQTTRKTLYRMLGKSEVKVLEQGFIGRRRQVQLGVKVLRGFFEQYGLLITGAAGVGKSCLSGKLIERFSNEGPDNKKLVVIHGRLEPGSFFQKHIHLFEQYGIQSGLEILNSNNPPEQRIAALFRQAFQELPCIIYLDDFEQNLERLSSSLSVSDEQDGFVLNNEALPLVRGLLRSLAWAGGKTNLIISSRYPFKLEHDNQNLSETQLVTIPLMSMRDADLKKKVENLEFISKSQHRDIYLEAAKGNPRILEWLDKIAAEEEKYNLTELKIRVQGQSTQYIAEYLFEIMAETQGKGFERFLRTGAVFRQPVPATAFELFGTSAQLKRAVWLTLVEQENKKDGTELCWVHPMIQKAEWEKLPKDEQKAAHKKASDWYDAEIRKLKSRPYGWFTEVVYHALQAGQVRRACYHAVGLGEVMRNMQLYRECLEMQQEVVDYVSDEVIKGAVQEKDGSVPTLLNDLGQAYKMMGDYPNVIQWTEKSLEIKKGIFGADDSKMAIGYNNLGMAYYSLGEYEKAIGYYEQALDIDRKNFGNKHPSVAREYNNLGGAYDSLDEYEKAIGYFKQALDIDRKTLGVSIQMWRFDTTTSAWLIIHWPSMRKALDIMNRPLTLIGKILGISIQTWHMNTTISARLIIHWATMRKPLDI